MPSVPAISKNWRKGESRRNKIICAYRNHLDMALLELPLDLVKVSGVEGVARLLVCDGELGGALLEGRAFGLLIASLCDILVDSVVVLVHGEDGRRSSVGVRKGKKHGNGGSLRFPL